MIKSQSPLNLKLWIISTFIILTTIIGLGTTVELRKHVMLGEQALQQANSSSLSNQISEFSLSQSNNTDKLTQVINELKYLPFDCLTEIGWLEMKLREWANASHHIDVCTKGLELSENMLKSIVDFHNSDVTKNQLIDLLHLYATDAENNSIEFNSIRSLNIRSIFRSITIYLLFETIFIVGGIIYMARLVINEHRKLLAANLSNKENAQRLSLYVQATGDGIWDRPVADNENEEHWSPQFRTLLGYGEEEAMPPSKPSFIHFTHPDQQDHISSSVQHAVNTDGVFKEELLLLTKSEQYRWFEIKGIVSINNATDERRLTGAIKDIHKRKTAENELIESHNFLQMVLDNNPDFVFVKDENHIVVKANKAFCNSLPEEMRDRVIGFNPLDEWLPYSRETIETHDDIAFKEGIFESVQRIKIKNQEDRLFDTRKIRFKNIEGEAFILCISHDVTDSEKLITQITRSNEELERFAFVASHDLQEPLRMIGSFSKLLDEKIGSTLDTESAEFLHIIQTSTVRMQELIQDLLIYAKLDQPNSSILKDVDLNSEIKEMLENYQPLIRETNTIFTYDPLPTLSTKPSFIRLIFGNLLTNAIKYQNPGKQPKIHISVSQKDSSWEFCVQDNGIGIEKRFLYRIFLPFKRLHRKEEYSGTGIGLAICKKAIDQLGGTIRVESTPGLGSKFIFELPDHPL